MSFLGSLGSAVPFVGSAVSAYAQAQAQKDANAKNLQIAREQMQFQERMSNSAYQRATVDMRAAGLNPMLAYSQGGESTPSGSAPVMQSVLGHLSSSAAELNRFSLEQQSVKSQIDLNKELASTQRKEQLLKEAEANQSNTSAKMIAYGLPKAAADAGVYLNMKDPIGAARTRMLLDKWLDVMGVIPRPSLLLSPQGLGNPKGDINIINRGR